VKLSESFIVTYSYILKIFIALIDKAKYKGSLIGTSPCAVLTEKLKGQKIFTQFGRSDISLFVRDFGACPNHLFARNKVPTILRYDGIPSYYNVIPSKRNKKCNDKFYFNLPYILESNPQASACNTDTTPTQPHRNSNTHRTKNNTTNVVIQQNSRKLLMMDILMSEIC